MTFLFNYRISAFSAIDIDAIEMGRWGRLCARARANAVTENAVCFFGYVKMNVCSSSACVRCSYVHLKYALMHCGCYSSTVSAAVPPCMQTHSPARWCAWTEGVGSVANYCSFFFFFFGGRISMGWPSFVFLFSSHHDDDFYLILFTLAACVA